MKAGIEKAEVYGADSTDGKWIAYCEVHGELVNAETKKSIIGIQTEEFCNCCRGNCRCYLWFGDKHFSETI
jgi:hypothetical protein